MIHKLNKILDRLPCCKIVGPELSDDLKIKTIAADNALHAHDTLNGLDGCEMFLQNTLRRLKRGLVVVLGPLATPFAGDVFKMNAGGVDLGHDYKLLKCLNFISKQTENYCVNDIKLLKLKCYQIERQNETKKR
mgnify:CR=1 FL=1